MRLHAHEAVAFSQSQDRVAGCVAPGTSDSFSSGKWFSWQRPNCNSCLDFASVSCKSCSPHQLTSGRAGLQVNCLSCQWLRSALVKQPALQGEIQTLLANQPGGRVSDAVCEHPPVERWRTGGGWAGCDSPLHLHLECHMTTILLRLMLICHQPPGRRQAEVLAPDLRSHQRRSRNSFRSVRVHLSTFACSPDCQRMVAGML